MNRNLKIIVTLLFIILVGMIIGFFLLRYKILDLPPNKSTSNQEPAPNQFPLQEVVVTKNGFSPQAIRAGVNSIVSWRNESGVPISINSDPHPGHTLNAELNLGYVEATSGSTQTFFSKPGEYPYHNEYNPEQIGVVIIELTPPPSHEVKK